MTLRRHNSGQLGFNVHNEGMVVDVEPNGLAQVAGLKQCSRLVEVGKISNLYTFSTYYSNPCNSNSYINPHFICGFAAVEPTISTVDRSLGVDNISVFKYRVFEISQRSNAFLANDIYVF